MGDSYVPGPAPVATTSLEQQGLTTAGQRRINLIWEGTQAIIAIGVVITYLYMAVKQIPVPDTVGNLLFVIVTFYFARTNSHRIGGVGVTADQRNFSSR